MLDTALNRRDKDPIDTLAGKRLAESDARIPCCRRNSQKHLCELSCAARLFFVAIIRFGIRLDRFAKAHTWLDKIDVDVESAAKSLRNDVEMESALRGDDRLAEFGVRHELKRGILTMQCGESGRNFVFLALGPRLQRCVERRFWIIRRRKFHGSVRQAQRVPSVRVFELYGGPDVNGSQFTGGDAVGG